MIDIPKGLRPLSDAATALKDLMDWAQRSNSLEQIEAEHASRIRALKAEEAATTAAVTHAKSCLSAVEAAAAERAKKVIESAERLLSDAGSQATERLLSVRIREQAVDEAAAALEASRSRLNAEITTLTKERSALDGDLEEAKATIAKAAAIRKVME